jgi:putative FmdB family regulatory protein
MRPPYPRAERPSFPDWKSENMPIYEFECGGCGEKFEAMRPVSGSSSSGSPASGSPAFSSKEAPPECPACGGGDVKKLISGFGISKPGIKMGKLSPPERAKAEKKIRRLEHKRRRRMF